jgi:hypothetical protein
MAKAELVAKPASNSHYETDFGVSSAVGAGNTKIGFLKASLRLAFKKPIFIMRIAVNLSLHFVFYGSFGKLSALASLASLF